MLSIKSLATVLFITAILFNIVNGADPNRMLQLVNAERKKAAQNHADYMANVKKLTHDEPSGDPGARMKAQGYNWSAYGENIAQGQKNEEEAMKS
ncbi:11402_t:CDS:2, partial [Racocetra fulgida]